MTFKIAKCLLTLCHGSVQVPISILLSFFNAGNTELHDGIRSYCNDVLLQYDCIIHPMNPSFYDNTCNESVECNLNGAHSEVSMSHEKLFEKKVEIKREEVPFTEAIVPSTNENNSTLNNQSSPQSMRLCSSADQVLVKEAPARVLPRPSSEPVFQQYNAPATIRHNRSMDKLLPMPSNESLPPINVCNNNESRENFQEEENAKLEDEEFGDDPVVISDSSEEECAPYKIISQKFQPAPRNGEKSMYSPRIKKTKLNDGEDNNGFHESDGEYIAILDTFCEIDADG